MCKKISTLLEDTCELELLKPLVVMQSDTDTEEKAQLLFEGKCMRGQILLDLSNLYEMQKQNKAI